MALLSPARAGGGPVQVRGARNRSISPSQGRQPLPPRLPRRCRPYPVGAVDGELTAFSSQATGNPDWTRNPNGRLRNAFLSHPPPPRAQPGARAASHGPSLCRPVLETGRRGQQICARPRGIFQEFGEGGERLRLPAGVSGSDLTAPLAAARCSEPRAQSGANGARW